MRLISGDATDALSSSSRGELEDRVMGKTAQVGVVSLRQHTRGKDYRNAWCRFYVFRIKINL